MAQGKEWNKDEVIEVLKEFFKLGCSVTKACKYAGIAQSTVATWIQNDEALRLKVEAWQNEMNVMARRHVRKLLEDEKESHWTASMDWLQRKERDEFSTRSEITGADGKDLNLSLTPEQQATLDKLLGKNNAQPASA